MFILKDKTQLERAIAKALNFVRVCNSSNLDVTKFQDQKAFIRLFAVKKQMVKKLFFAVVKGAEKRLGLLSRGFYFESAYWTGKATSNGINGKGLG